MAPEGLRGPPEGIGYPQDYRSPYNASERNKMPEVKVVEVLKMDGPTTTGRILDENLCWSRATSLYLSYQGRRKGARKIQGTPALIRQDDENFIDIDT